MTTLGYELEWYDPQSERVQKLFLRYFIEDCTIELLHSERSSIFLKRIFYPSVTLNDLFIGNSIMIYNRLLTIKAYANPATQKYMGAREVHFLTVIPNRDFDSLGAVLSKGREHNLKFIRLLTAGASGSVSPSISVDSGDIFVEQVGVGVSNPNAFIDAVCSLKSGIRSSVVAAKDLTFNIRAYKPRSSHQTLCLIKPHLVKSEQAGDVINDIVAAGFTIESVMSFHLSTSMSETLFSVYRNIYSQYIPSLEHMSSGPSIAVYISGRSDNVVKDFRAFCGPLEPELAALVGPGTLRAKYGKDRVHNAIHCTDLIEDGGMECTFFFETLAAL